MKWVTYKRPLKIYKRPKHALTSGTNAQLLETGKTRKLMKLTLDTDIAKTTDKNKIMNKRPIVW